MHPLHHFNPWAILVSALIQWFLGAAWYSPALFVKPWMAALKIVPKEKDSAAKKSLIVGMIASLIGSLLASFILAHFILWANAETIPFGLFIGFLAWLGFIAAPNFAQGIYEQRPQILFIINSGYWLVGLLITGAILATWH
jgi:hypothetical protein